MHLNKCRILFLDNNKLGNIQPGMFDGLSALEKLSLTRSNIVAIESGSFKSLENINELYLNENHLTTLRKDLFVSIPLKSRYLGLGYNPLHCDRRICWLRQGEEDNWIFFYWSSDYPECANGDDWAEVNCSVTGWNLYF